VALEKLKAAGNGFDFRLLVDKDNNLLAAVWMNGRQRARLGRYGEMVGVDATAGTNEVIIDRISNRAKFFSI
jgi:hypothetical protein